MADPKKQPDKARSSAGYWSKAGHVKVGPMPTEFVDFKGRVHPLKRSKDEIPE